MKKVSKILPDLQTKYILPNGISYDDVLFVDIETTGFTARTSCLYMIGCIYQREDGFHLIQWFAENYEEEEKVISRFLDFALDFSYLIHFNGNQFDIPYIEQKAVQYEFECDLSSMNGIDIYKRVQPLKNFLKLTNLKQKSIEKFLGIEREDIYGGGELISIYHDYIKEPTDYSLNLLLLHNEEDLCGMVRILPILSYSDLYTCGVKVIKASANFYSDYAGKDCAEIVLKLKSLNPLPEHVTCYENDCYFIGEGDEITLKVPIHEEEMKFFYPDYKSYYYLPAEDMALHKSVASFVDPSHRQQAKASNCYTRKNSQFIEQYYGTFAPIFKRSFEDKHIYLELTDTFKKDRDGFSKYATEVLQMMINSRKDDK